MAGISGFQGGGRLLNMRMKHLLWLVVAAIAVVSIGALGAPRGPIAILGNADFTEENGVVGGSGTAADPYIVAGWDIDLGADDTYGVQIENVTASFVLRGLVIRGANNQDGAAIRIGFSNGGAVEECIISDGLVGIEIISSMDLQVADCMIESLGYGLRVEGESAFEYRHDIGRSNVYNGKPIVYIYGADGRTIEEERTTHLTVAGSRNVTIRNNEVTNGDGLLLAFVTDSTVTGNAVYRTTPVWTEHGLHLYRSDRNLVTSNSMWNNRLAGLQLGLSTGNQIIGNQLLSNHTGIRLLASDGNTLRDNVAYANVVGVTLTGGSSDNTLIGNIAYHENTKEGIAIDSGLRNRIERNGTTDCEVGILVGAAASQNVFFGNTVVSGVYGFSISGSDNVFEQNLVSQQSRGILFPETYGDSVAARNVFRRNVLADNGNHVYTNLDSEDNEFTGNAMLGLAQSLVLDHGTDNVWTVDGVGNYWGRTVVTDEDGDGTGDEPIAVYTAGELDTAPIVSVDPIDTGLGILSTLSLRTVSVQRADGSTVELEVLRAADGPGRWAGFRGFPEEFLPGYPGILFDYGSEKDSKFTMETVLFDLDIVFFSSQGTLVGRTTMVSNSEDLYTAESPFRYAIELPAGTLEELSIGAGSKLILP